MEINEIIMDSIIYPSKNIKALGIYMLISVIIGIVFVATGLGSIASADGVNIVVAIIGLIILLALVFLVSGYMLDITKYGIERRNDSPEVDFVNQVSNGIKYFIISFVFLLIPSIVFILSGDNLLLLIVSMILYILFGLFLYMAQSRLAQTGDLGHAINIKGAYDDLMKLGFTKVLITVVVVSLIVSIITGIISAVFGVLGSELLTTIVTSIAEIYLLFFENRAIGLLYSDI